MAAGSAGPHTSRDTSQRRAIRQALDDADRPLSAPEILAAAQSAVPRLGVATVYRAVKTLQAQGVLRQLDLPGDVPRYELTGKGHHHHFHCRGCERVFEVHSCPGGLQHLAPPGFELETHEIILYGLCPSCAAARGARRRRRSGR